jgi:predicted AAA+ superfamily ATPase
MIQRNLGAQIIRHLSIYPVVSLTGPRQSGKTTLLRSLLPGYDYCTLEDPDVRSLAIEDPRKFLEIQGSGMIIDEVQRVPELFSYIQGIVDNRNQNGMYVLSGSQNFLLMEKITQTLAGRVALLQLLPLSMGELADHGTNWNSWEELAFRGFFPRLYDREIQPNDYYPFYIQTYVERDVRLLRNITDHTLFIRFIRLVAGRVGQVVNIASLATDAGISPITARSWLAILEASYIIFQLQPHHKNFNKRLIKNAKLYFHDTGLACSLLGISSPNQLGSHFAQGAIFENFIVSEFVKASYNRAKQTNLYFWLDKHKKEIDLLVEGDVLTPIEIKSGKTFNTSFLDQLNYWNTLAMNQPGNSFLVYGGESDFNTSTGQVKSWRSLNSILVQLF